MRCTDEQMEARRHVLGVLGDQILPHCSEKAANVAQLLEEGAEFVLATRGLHDDSQAMELLEIAGIAIVMFTQRPEAEQANAVAAWLERHGPGQYKAPAYVFLKDDRDDWYKENPNH